MRRGRWGRLHVPDERREIGTKRGNASDCLPVTRKRINAAECRGGGSELSLRRNNPQRTAVETCHHGRCGTIPQQR